MTTLSAVERGAVPAGRRGSLTERILGFAVASHSRACGLLIALALVCFLPGFASLQPMDRDEPRFAQASKQMLETGDFVDIRFQDEARHKKPAGIHWLQSGAVAAAEILGIPEARTTIAVYRVPSFLGALATVLLTYWAALAFAGRREAFLAASFIAASIVLMAEARLAKTDAVLAACSVATMGALARVYFARRIERLGTSTVVVFWLALAAGILIKGPLILMFSGLAALVLSVRERSIHWLRALRPAWGIALTLLIVAPWFIAIAIKSGGAFYAAAVGDDLLGKVATGQQQHWAPPGAYLLVFFATFWPAAALAAIAAPFAWIHRREDGLAFALAWIVPSWLVFEAVPTKLPHYVLPLLPAIAIVTAVAIARAFVGPHRKGAKLVAGLIPLIPIAVTIAAAWAGWSLDRTVPRWGLFVLLLACAVAVVAWLAFARGEVTRAALAGVLSSAIVSIGAFGFTQPSLGSLKISPRLAQVARDLDCPRPAVATLGYREPSLIFLTGTSLRLLEKPRDAAAFLGEGSCRLAFVESRFEEEFGAELARGGLKPSVIARVEGFNINGGRRVDIGAYAVRP